ncbi:MAG: dihydrolipoyl dehydrogenase [Gammaproteobacteria bacterium]|nr:MAG: dihydrolipoyl dehydrogenase [Gammaproteobacteria bacterium]
MSNTVEVRVPDIGDFDEVEVIDILVSPGAGVNAEDSLITLESEKAAMDIPSPVAGVVKEITVAVGDRVSEGSVIAMMEAGNVVQPSEPAPEQPEPASTPAPVTDVPEADMHAEVLVLGSGPGGYTAAFRAADLGKKVVLVERYSNIGGVCLNVGCIPSKALLHAAKVIDEAHSMADKGVVFGEPEIDIDKLRGWKDSVVAKLTGGLAAMAKQRKVEIVTGYGRFTSSNTLAVEGDGGMTTISFDSAIIAAGSRVTQIPGFPYDDPRMIDSTGALQLAEVPNNMLVIGGGIIGMEMATVYHEMGAKVSVVELSPQIMPGVDKDIVRPITRRMKGKLEAIWLNAKVTEIKTQKNGLKVFFEGKDAPPSALFDKVLYAIGRRPNGLEIDADKAGVAVDERGFIAVDKQQRTNVPHIFAIGDIVGQPMLAHKATHEAKVAAEVIAGQKSSFDALVIPSVAYTDPEVAWVGETEITAKEKGIKYGVGKFPWAASGRSLGIGRDEGMTKLLFDEHEHVIGAGIVGPNAGDLIAEVALAIEMGADATDIGLTIHPHPTLSETVAMAAEVFEGTITDLYIPKRKK